MLPPPRNGGVASSSSARPHSAPMPDGPHILWLENAAKSASHACTSVALWGTYWQASTMARAPASWAAAHSSVTGVSVPSTLLIAVNDSTLAPSSSAVEVGEVELAVGGQRDPAQLDAPLGGEHVPRHDVGVVLHVGEHDDVAGAEVGPAPRLGDEVERLGGVLGEHDLVGVAGVDEAGDLGPGGLEGVGGLGGEAVGAAVDRRVGRLVEARHRVDHATAASATCWPSRGSGSGRRRSGRCSSGNWALTVAMSSVRRGSSMVMLPSWPGSRNAS